MIERFRLDQYF